MKFKVGDVIKQRYQKNAAERLVLGYAPTITETYIIYDPTYGGIRWVLGFAHDYVRTEKVSKNLIQNLICHPSHAKWIMGDQAYDLSW